MIDKLSLERNSRAIVTYGNTLEILKVKDRSIPKELYDECFPLIEQAWLHRDNTAKELQAWQKELRERDHALYHQYRCLVLLNPPQKRSSWKQEGRAFLFGDYNEDDNLLLGDEWDNLYP